MEQQFDPAELTDLETSQPQTGSRIISKVLSPAIRLWLRSQVESATALKFQVTGSDRQLLRGYLSKITVSAAQAVYQGLHLSHLHLTAAQIQINIGQVLKGKPLQLLDSVPVTGEVTVTQADLTASLAAALLQQGLTELMQLVLNQLRSPAQCAQTLEQSALIAQLTQPLEFQVAEVTLQANRFLLRSEVTASTGSGWLTLASSLRLIDGSHLQLTELELHYLPTLEAQSLKEQPSRTEPVVLPIHSLDLDLGNTVNLQKLIIEPERVTCAGQIMVMP